MALADRDERLSQPAGTSWPFGPLLGALALSPTADLLGVGAGDGRGLRLLRGRGHRGRLAGIDPQPGRPEVEQGEADALPFADASFDVVAFLRVLGHLRDARAALAEAWRVLRPGGRVVLAAHGADHLRETWRALGQEGLGPGPEEALRSALAEMGWTARRLDLRLPVTLTAVDAGVVTSYGSNIDVPQTAFPVDDTLHLALFVVVKPA
ncbi:methyltransferase domain-containing protein [Deinococcus sp. YIM 134068]|uniref:class I SAM-dependent methyltransferase n=1 Tax=Deinococcus lichenicola TaxID=3118910 RepID=UPI002F93745C